MALLRTHKKNGNHNEELREQIRGDIRSIEAEIDRLQAKKVELEKDLLSLHIEPFKIGDYALVKVPSGKSVKEQKCLLEHEHGILYVRPIKSDGELSGRHFSLVPVAGHKYSEYLKEVK